MLQIFARFTYFRFCTIPSYGSSRYSHQQLKKMVLQFPYCKMPNKIHKAQLDEKTQDKQKPKIIDDAIAFGSLTYPKMSLLQKYHEALFPDQKIPEDTQKVDIFANKIFQKHFLKRINEINYKESVQNRQYFLKILCYLCEQKTLQTSITVLQKQFTKFLKQYPNHQKLSLSCQSYLLRIYQYFSHHQKQYQTEFMNYTEYFTQKYRSQSKQNQQTLKSALIILNTPNLSDVFPRILIIESIQIIDNNIKTLQDWQFYEILSSLFEIDIKISQKLINNITSYIIASTKTEQSVKIPLLIKLMNLLHKKKLGTNSINTIIRDNPIKFNSIFFKKNTNKQVFLQVLVKNSQLGQLPDQIKLHFNKYVQERFEQLVKNQKQIEFYEILRLFKLILKFYDNLYDSTKKKLAEQIQSKIMLAYEEYPDVLFWCIIYLYRTDDQVYPKDTFIKQETLKLLNKYDTLYKKSNSDQQKKKSLQKILDLNYQLARKRMFMREAVKKLGEYNYEYKTLEDEQKVIYVYYLLLKIDDSIMPQMTKIRIFQQTKSHLEHCLQGKPKFYNSLKNLLTIANIIYRIDGYKKKLSQRKQCENIGVKNIFIWYKIQDKIMKIYKSGKKISINDWKILKKYLKDYREELRNFNQVIEDSITHPQNHKAIIQQYTKKMNKKKST